MLTYQPLPLFFNNLGMILAWVLITLNIFALWMQYLNARKTPYFPAVESQQQCPFINNLKNVEFKKFLPCYKQKILSMELVEFVLVRSLKISCDV